MFDQYSSYLFIYQRNYVLPNDELGSKMIYPTSTRSGIAKSFFMKDGWDDSPRARLDEKVSGNNTDGYKLDDNSKVRISFSADSKDTDIGCDNDFTASAKRGYVYKSNDWKNVELTVYFKVSNWSPIDNYIVMKGPTGEHHSDSHCCSGSSYNGYFLHDNPTSTEFAKEMYHVNYDRRGTKKIPGINYSILGHGWFGAKWVHYISADKSSAVSEIWYNGDGNGQNWILANKTTDTGGWNDGGDSCNGKKDQILLWGNARMMIRWDFRGGSDIKFKKLSIREIDPFAQFNENPVDPNNPGTNTPTVSTIISNLKLQWHVNYYDGNLCAGLGAIKAFEETTQDVAIALINNSTEDYRTRAACYCVNSSSQIKCTPVAFDIPLSRNSSTSASLVSAKIWSSNNTVRYTSPTTYAQSSLPAYPSYAIKSFDFSSNTYEIQPTDKIGIEYLDTTTGEEVYHYRDLNSSTDTNTQYIDFNENTDVWDSPMSTVDLACTVWKN